MVAVHGASQGSSHTLQCPARPGQLWAVLQQALLPRDGGYFRETTSMAVLSPAADITWRACAYPAPWLLRVWLPGKEQKSSKWTPAWGMSMHISMQFLGTFDKTPFQQLLGCCRALPLHFQYQSSHQKRLRSIHHAAQCLQKIGESHSLPLRQLFLATNSSTLVPKFFFSFYLDGWAAFLLGWQTWVNPVEHWQLKVLLLCWWTSLDKTLKKQIICREKTF